MVKWIVIIASLLGVGGYFIWRLSLPVEIIGVHDENVLIVKNFPLTKQGRIAWWEKNKPMLKEKYQIPKEGYHGTYLVIIMDIGDGYKVMPETDQGSDLACFNDIKVAENCIEKNRLLTIMKGYDGKVDFY